LQDSFTSHATPGRWTIDDAWRCVEHAPGSFVFRAHRRCS
jgi:hypothetical protein